jgi:hypothetical protein
MLQATRKELMPLLYIGQPDSGYVGSDNLNLCVWLEQFWDSRRLQGVDIIAVQPEDNGYQNIHAFIVDNNGKAVDNHTQNGE